jgi:hypothetical protein
MSASYLHILPIIKKNHCFVVVYCPARPELAGLSIVRAELACRCGAEVLRGGSINNYYYPSSLFPLNWSLQTRETAVSLTPL